MRAAQAVGHDRTTGLPFSAVPTGQPALSAPAAVYMNKMKEGGEVVTPEKLDRWMRESIGEVAIAPRSLLFLSFSLFFDSANLVEPINVDCAEHRRGALSHAHLLRRSTRGRRTGAAAGEGTGVATDVAEDQEAVGQGGPHARRRDPGGGARRGRGGGRRSR